MAGQRFKQVAVGVATATLVGFSALVATRGTTAAARSQEPRSEPSRKIGGDNRPRPADEPSADALQAPRDEEPPAIVDPPVGRVRGSYQARRSEPATIDPAKDAEEFVARTHKEAADRVAALDQEAAELKARLAKVEAASARIKAAFGHLGGPAEIEDAPVQLKPVVDREVKPESKAAVDPGPPPTLPDVPKAEG